MAREQHDNVGLNSYTMYFSTDRMISTRASYSVDSLQTACRMNPFEKSTESIIDCLLFRMLVIFMMRANLFRANTNFTAFNRMFRRKRGSVIIFLIEDRASLSVHWRS